MLSTTDLINYCIFIICRQPKCIKFKLFFVSHKSKSPDNYQKFTGLLLIMTHTQRKLESPGDFIQ